MTKGRWEVTTEPIIVDNSKMQFRATLRDLHNDTEKSWTGDSREDVLDTARDAAQRTENNERHMANPMQVEMLV